MAVGEANPRFIEENERWSCRAFDSLRQVLVDDWLGFVVSHLRKSGDGARGFDDRNLLHALIDPAFRALLSMSGLSVITFVSTLWMQGESQ
jgi:hypothetical protein